MTELKPCPFCGSEAELHPTYDMDTNETDGWFAWCNNDTCECKPETEQFFTEAEAIAAWNTRAERVTVYPNGESAITINGITYVPERTCYVKVLDNLAWWECQSCGALFDMANASAFRHKELPNYCPNCGAKVVGE